MRAAAANLKNLTLETGGKSPLIVFGDADLDQAVKWSHLGVMGKWAGKTVGVLKRAPR